MDLLIFLGPASVLMGAIGLAAFIWSVKANQYDDMKGAAARILLDDEDDDKAEDA